MRVVCDNCGASYKIPDSKLTREVNKATCRKCGNPILIRRPEMAAKETAAHGPNPSTEERTLITSAAELERQARMRASNASHSGMDDAAMDPRPTQVSPDNSHTEATVPRDEAADRAVAAMQAPSDASTIVQSPTSYVSTTLVPEHLGPPRAAASPPPSMQVPGPIPPPTPMNQARAVAAYVPAAPPPLAPPGVAPAPSLAQPQSFAPAPVPAAVAPPPAYVPTPSPAASAPPAPVPAPAPRAVPAAPASTGGFSPAGDLTVALLLSLLSVFGVLLILVNGLIGSTIIAGLGTFLALLGGVGSALVVLTGNRGTRKASIPLAVGGGFVLAFMGGVGQGAVNWAASFDAGSAVPEPVAVATKKTEPPPAPVETPKAPEPDPALTLAAPPAEAVPAPPPAEVAPRAPVVTTPPPTPAPTPVVTTPPPAPTSSKSTSTTSKSTSSSPSSSTPERIQPKTTSTSPSSSPSTSTSTKSTPTTSTSTKSTSTSSTTTKAAEPEAAPAKAAALDTRVIDTMIKNNKGVKLCFIKQKNDGGSLPSGVKVKLTVQPSGTVSSAKIPSGEWKDTDFDGCLSGAVKSIQFPPFDGDPLTITYPFPI